MSIRRFVLCGLLLACVMAGSASAQSPIARFVYEEAEEAYAKQDYSTTLIKLEKAEKEFGKINPPILYLRIMSRNEILKASVSLDFDNLNRLRADCAQYLKDYGENEHIRDQVREVYKVSTTLEQYPATRAEYEAKLQAEEARRRAEAAEATRRRQEEARKACLACVPEMVAIPGKNYEIGKYEVTQAQWQAVMGNNPSQFKGDNLPVENVSWNDIQEYLTKLNQKTGKQYRLPTEAEWEYACYGGSQSEYCGGNDIGALAWYYGNSGNSTHPVGQKQANGYGLYDMSGNVWEWTENCWDSTCSSRVLRGGSWSNLPANVRASNRKWNNPAFRFNNLGFRLAGSAQ